MSTAQFTPTGKHAFTTNFRFENQRILLDNGRIAITASDIAEVSYPKKNRALIQLKNGDVLEIQFPNIRGLLRLELGSFNERISYFEKAMGKGLWPIAILTAAFVLLLLGLWFWLLPFIAFQAADSFPKEQEIELGNTLYAQYMLSEKVDSSGSVLLNEYARQMRFPGDYPLKFTLVHSETINAFALPGGNIVVYSGILKDMKHEGQLAALLAHEVSHVVHRHSVKSMMRELAGSIVLNLVLGDAGAMAGTLASQAEGFRGLSYSRSLETEADLKGLEILINNNIDPQGMTDLLQHLNESSGDIHPPEFLSTHPLPESRIEALKAAILQQAPRQKDTLNPSLFNQLKQSSISAR